MSAKRRDPADALRIFEERLIDEIIADPTLYPLTEDDQAWVQTQHAAMQQRIAELQRQRAASLPIILPAGPLPPSIAAMGRAEVLAQLEALGQVADIGIASLDRQNATDGDLRHLLAAVIDADVE